MSTSSAREIAAIGALLESSKVKERQEGIQAVRDKFKHKDIAADLDQTNGKMWLYLYQAMFAAVVNEKAACLKKGLDSATQPARKRLSDASYALRELVERSVAHINRKALKPLISHLLQMIVYQRRLFDPVALNYIKTLRVVISHQPHHDNLDEFSWINLLHLSFSVVLEDPLSANGDFTGEEVSSDAMDIDNDAENSSDDDTPSSPRKRSRKEPPDKKPPSTSSSRHRAPHPKALSPEQLEFAGLIHTLLENANTPYLSREHPYLTRAILRRFVRFYTIYPSDTSAHRHLINGLNIVLSHIALNKIQDVVWFGHQIWEPLISLWSTRDRSMKEGIVITLRTLRPFVTSDNEHINSPDDRARTREGVARLVNALGSEGGNRGGLEPLSLDFLRLQLEVENERRRPFQARVVRSGLGFNASHALTWAAIELHADCLAQVFLTSESDHMHLSGSSTQVRKRKRITDPITTLADSISTLASSPARVYLIQVLVFLIDRHWLLFHAELHQKVWNTLQGTLASDDTLIATWSYLALATLAHIGWKAEFVDWDTSWDHTCRKTNVTGVSRAACLAALALLTHCPLNHQQILKDIESFSNDLVVQGPTFPFDSVCALLCKFVAISNQDVRLYGSHLEDKILGWLSKTWNAVNGTINGFTARSKLEPHSMDDVIQLMEVVCGLIKPFRLGYTILFPECALTSSITDERSLSNIYDYMVDARLPDYTSIQDLDAKSDTTVSIPIVTPSIAANIAPKDRERMTSAFNLKSVEGILAEWENDDTALQANCTPEQMRRSIDIAVLALSFEAALNVNGTRGNQRVLNMAGRLLLLLLPCLCRKEWEPEQRALFFIGLEPLIKSMDETIGEDMWQTMLGPCGTSGIKRGVLKALVNFNPSLPNLDISAQMGDTRRALWKTSHIHDNLRELLSAIKSALKSTLGIVADEEGDSGDLDDAEHTMKQSGESDQSKSPSGSHYYIRVCIQTSINLLTIGAMFHQQSAEPTRDKTLVDLMLASSDPQFLLFAPQLLNAVRRRNFALGVGDMDKLLDRIHELLESYTYSKSHVMQLFVVDFLISTTHVWVDPLQSTGDHRVLTVLSWLSKMLSRNKIGSWKTRDHLARLFDAYISHDPVHALQQFQSPSNSSDEDEDEPPSGWKPTQYLLPLIDDHDVRVRFYSITAVSCLFKYVNGTDMAEDLYTSVHDLLATNTTEYEQMLTRVLTLGNIMVVSSPVRRGAYFGLLETSCTDKRFEDHGKAVLTAVTTRLGFRSLAHLCQTYAMQLGVSSVLSQTAFFGRVSHNLLGYSSQREVAEDNFSRVCPIALEAIAGNPSDTLSRSLFDWFAGLCGRGEKQALRDCFPTQAALRILTTMESSSNTVSARRSEELRNALETLASQCANPNESAQHVLECFCDEILVHIVQAIGNYKESTSEIARAFKDEGNTMRDLFKFRALTPFTTHKPHPPCYTPIVVVRSLQWFSTTVPMVTQPATIYHALHKLFAATGKSPLINEQLRLVDGICILVTVYENVFQRKTLLQTLLFGAVALLAQSDLSHASQSIIDWGCHLYLKTTETDARFSDLLSRVAHIGHDLTHDSDGVIQGTGQALIVWIEELATVLYAATHVRSQVVSALHLWPRAPSGNLAECVEGIDYASLTALLSESRLSTSKFRLIRRLNEIVDAGESTERFSSHDFWHLKECIPSEFDIQDQDIRAFISVLFANGGRIKSISGDATSSRSIGQHHQTASRSTSGVFTSVSPKGSVIMRLVDKMYGSDTEKIHRAYTCLCLLLPLGKPFWEDHAWRRAFKVDSRSAEELKYLAASRGSPHAAVPAILEQLAMSTRYIELSSTFSLWITASTQLLCDVLSQSDAFYDQLVPVLKNDITFAAELYPVLVHEVLRQAEIKDNSRSTTAQNILSTFFTDVLSFPSVDVLCTRAIIDVIIHLRNFDHHPLQQSSKVKKDEDPLIYNRWLRMDFDLLAQGAITSGAYTTALLFLEVSIDEPLSTSTISDEAREQIMYDIYSHIQEPDGFYGIKSRDIQGFLLRRLQHEKQWTKALQFHGANYEGGNKPSHPAIVQSLHAFGFDNLAVSVAGNESSSLGYQLGWRTENWDLPNVAPGEQHGSSLYLALRAIHRERDPERIRTTLRSSLRYELSRLRRAGNEDMTEIEDGVQTVICLGEIFRWIESPISNAISLKDVSTEELQSLRIIPQSCEFNVLEAVIATRMSLLKSAKQRQQEGQIGNLQTPLTQLLIEDERSYLCDLSKAARAVGLPQIALNSVVRAQHLQKSRQDFSVSQEFSSVLWMQNEQKMAVAFLLELRRNNPNLSTETQALLLAQLGEWVSHACLESPVEVRTNYFEPAHHFIENLQDAPALASIPFQYGSFAEAQFRELSASGQADQLRQHVERKRAELNNFTSALQQSGGDKQHQKELSQAQRKTQVLLEEDNRQFTDHLQTLSQFLQDAIRMFADCLHSSDKFDVDAIISLCSLWFSNFSDEKLNTYISGLIKQIPSRKFVILAHQLAARMTTSRVDSSAGSQATLHDLMLCLCREHPFHSLYQVYALRQGGSSSKPKSSRRSSTALNHTSESQSQRSEAAVRLFNTLRTSSVHEKRVKDIEFLCDAYHEWALFSLKGGGKGRDGRPLNLSTGKGSVEKVPDFLRLTKIEPLDVPVSTYNTPVDPTGAYKDVPTIKGYSGTFTTAGGVNLPKISDCVGSDGRHYKQLFKGNDDLRQDAVMEQMFELVNHVLRKDPETRRRVLSIRSYKVIPLAPQAGLMEFVTDTEPLHAWVAPAHSKYNPGDISMSKAVEKLKAARTSTREDTQKKKLLATFIELKTQFHPVFRHYFTEKHKVPLAWYDMRLKYARSAATTSIVGHIVGLGDRHLSNILIHKITGEVVHIDLGIAFDQGRLLPIPELVPFRLTADMVDGLGSSGVEGVYRRCAEETLRVLRDGSEVIKTVLEVFKYDPLHSWTINPFKLKKVQDEAAATDSTGSVLDYAEESADRALRSVNMKLDKSLSVEYTVNQLITAATDPGNLSQIFYGWNPQA